MTVWGSTDRATSSLTGSPGGGDGVVGLRGGPVPCREKCLKVQGRKKYHPSSFFSGVSIPFLLRDRRCPVTSRLGVRGDRWPVGDTGPGQIDEVWEDRFAGSV